MIVSIFKDIWELTDPIHAPVTTILKRIKEGKSRDLIERIRTEEDKEKRTELKKELPSICFSGKFSKRNDESLIEHSGLIVLDIDGVKPEDMDTIKSLVCADSNVYACFVSPSGNGFKILVKIPAKANQHFSLFKALKDHFDNLVSEFESTIENKKKIKGGSKKIDPKQGKYLRLHIDPSGKNVSRVCYESFDPDLFYNEESDTWIEIYNETKIQEEVGDQDEIIDGIQKWMDKNDQYYEGNRNNYLHKFASALCRYGVTESKTLSYLQYKFNDYPEKELIPTVKSAYKANTFGCETFVKTYTKQGTSEIHLEIPDKNITAFWMISDKGKVSIDTKQLIKFIHANGYWIHEPIESPEDWYFVQIKNMVVRRISDRQIKLMVLRYVSRNAPEPVYDELQMNARYFSKSFLNALPTAKIKQVRDTETDAFIFFDGFYYKINKEGCFKMDYIDLKGQHIWEKQICEQTITEYTRDYQDFDFVNFLINSVDGDQGRFKSLCAAIGYAIHTHKRMSLTKVPYFVDKDGGEIKGMQKGGTGKSLAMHIIRFVRNVVVVDGKDYDPRSAFKFQRVKEDTQVVVIEDFESDLKDLFVKVTDGFSIEAKQKAQIYIPFSESPKILINSNQLPSGVTDSYLRRMHVVQFGNFYSVDHTPFDEHGREFFNDYNQDDWNKFFSFLFDCTRHYLIHGLQEYRPVNLKFQLLQKRCGPDFVEYWQRENTKNLDEWQNARDIVEDFIATSDYDKLEPQVFYNYCRQMCSIFGWKYEDSSTGRNRKMRFIGFDLDINHNRKPESKEDLFTSYHDNDDDDDDDVPF